MVTIIDSDESDDEPAQLQYKVIVLGDGAVGKTSLAMRFTGDYCSTSYKQTIGLDFFLKQMLLPSDLHVAVQLWDIGGQTIGGKMIGNYIFGAQAVLLVYDITNYQSFVNLEDWLTLVQRTFGADNMPYVALVANKIDLKHLRAVSSSKHKGFAQENDIVSFYVSAKTGEGVPGCFLRVTADLAGVVLSKADMDAVSQSESTSAVSTSQAAGALHLGPQQSQQSTYASVTGTSEAQRTAQNGTSVPTGRKSKLTTSNSSSIKSKCIVM